MALQKTLEDTLARFDEVQAQTATLEEEVVDEVRMDVHSCAAPRWSSLNVLIAPHAMVEGEAVSAAVARRCRR